MTFRRESNRAELHPEKKHVLGAGGEGNIHRLTDDPSLALKIHHRPKPELAAKLRAMLENVPVDPTRDQGHVSLAWPVDAVISDRRGGGVVGYLMPRVDGMRPVFVFYNPASRLKECPLFNFAYLSRTARNIAAVFATLHEAGYVVGDVNESNILVSENALTTFVDTDSFQIRDRRDGGVFRCPVGKPQFTPPELQGKNFAEIDRTPEHDLFGLGVLIFHLLMEGTHPFDGVHQGQGDPPMIQTRIAEGHFPHGTRPGPYRPKPSAPPFDILPPELRRLFLECFEAGFDDPAARPTAARWRDALHQAEKSLIVCAERGGHYYGPHLAACPWCERTKKLRGRDPFPSRYSLKPYVHPNASEAVKPVESAALPPLGAFAPTVTAAVPQAPREEAVGCSGGCLVVILIVVWVIAVFSVGAFLVIRL